MDRQSVSRRKFLSSLGAVAATSPLSVSGAGSEQSTDKSRPEFGTPIERAWKVNHDRNHVELGAIRDDTAYISFMEGGQSSVTEIARINRFTGTKEWSRELEDYNYPPQEYNGKIYFDGYENIYCWDAATGEEIWTRSLPGQFQSLEVVGDTILATAHDIEETTYQGVSTNELTYGVLSALSHEDGETKWTTSSQKAIWNPTIADDQVFANETRLVVKNDQLVKEQGQIVTYDIGGGSTNWKSDRIAPEHFSETGDEVVVLTTNNDIIIFEKDGTTRWESEDLGDDYFITEDKLFVSDPYAGLTVHDFHGNELVSEPLYESTYIEYMYSGSESDLLLLGTVDEVIAIDKNDITEKFRKSLPSKPQGISARPDLIFITYDENQIEAYDRQTGEQVWQNEIRTDDQISWRIYDGFVYVYGTGAPFRAFGGARGRALRAVHNAEQSRDSISGSITTALGWGDVISRAETAISNGEYERAENFVSQFKRRQTGIRGVLGTAGLGTVYATTRAGGSKLQQRRLKSVCADVESQYPIDHGALSGAKPKDLLAQAQTAKTSIDSPWALKIREVFSNDYTELIDKLNEVSNRHSDLVKASETLDEVDGSLIPESLTAELRSAIEDSNVERIDELTSRVSRADQLFEQLEEFKETVKRSSLSVSTANYSEFVTRELEGTGGVFEGISLTRVFESLKDGLEAYEAYRGQFNVFDLTSLKSTLNAALSNPHETEEATLWEIAGYEKLFEAAKNLEEVLSNIDFSQLDKSRDAVIRNSQSMFEDHNVEGLNRLAEDLHQLHAGRWSRPNLFEVTPIEFEYLVAALFDDMGYEVVVTDEQGDKGIDVIARNQVEVLAIQVKQHSEGNNIGRPTIQQTIGAMAQAGADQAVVVTSAGFTKTARQASHELGNAVNLIDGSDFVQLLTESSLYPSSDGSEYRSRARTSKSSSEQSHQRNADRGHSQAHSTSRSMSEQKAYEVLGLDPPVSQDEIKVQYREKVKEVHPDQGGSDELFKKVRKAYVLLSED